MEIVYQLKWYGSTGVCPRGDQVRQRCGRWLNPLSSMKTIVRPSFLAFFLTPANVSASRSGSSPHPAPAPARWDADSFIPSAAECAKPARHGSEPHIPLRSGAPPATPSTNRFRTPELPAHASARARSSAGLRHAAEVYVRLAPLSASRVSRRPPVAGPSGSPTADGLRLAAPLPTDGLPSSATAPPASAAAPVPENLVALPLDFPCAHPTTGIRECHYIMQYSIDVLWTNKDMLFRPRYGRVGCLALSYLWLFELMAPVIELGGMATIALAACFGALSRQLLVEFLLFGYAFATVISIGSVLQEEITYKRYNDWQDVARLVTHCFLEHFPYRQMHMIWRLQGLWQYLRGDMVWKELKRQGPQTADETPVSSGL